MNSTHRTTGPVARAALLVPLVFGSSLPSTVPELSDPSKRAPLRNPAGIVVPADLGPTVAFALLHSPTFREQFERARNWPHVTVHLRSVPLRSLIGMRARGNTNWLELPRVIRGVGLDAGRVSHAGTIECRAAIAPRRELAASLAHELAHANELARYGSIRRAPGFRPSGSGSYLAETQPAIEIGRRVTAELKKARRNLTS